VFSRGSKRYFGVYFGFQG